jgi:hypothetical protein
MALLFPSAAKMKLFRTVRNTKFERQMSPWCAIGLSTSTLFPYHLFAPKWKEVTCMSTTMEIPRFKYGFGKRTNGWVGSVMDIAIRFFLITGCILTSSTNLPGSRRKLDRRTKAGSVTSRWACSRSCTSLDRSNAIVYYLATTSNSTPLDV